VNANHRWAISQERFDFGREFLRQVLKLRTETRLRALSGPDQLFTECRQRRALAAMGLDQRDAEKVRPLFDQVPDVPVGQLGIEQFRDRFSSAE
jgi:hypothetical protein